jgi:ABC-type sugar transport system ATPase subunit
VDIRGGESHSFVGENGAGKSTLGKVVAGVYGADEGHVIVDDVHVERWNPGAAQRKGVSMIAQE